MKLQDSSTWHTNQKNDLDGVSTPQNSDADSNGHEESSVFATVVGCDDPDAFKKITNFEPIALKAFETKLRTASKVSFLLDEENDAKFLPKTNSS